MSCADCAGEMVECVDCRADSAYAAAREEGRREGYAACTADVVAWLKAQAKAADELYAEIGAGSYRSRAMALEGAAGEIADGEHRRRRGEGEAVRVCSECGGDCDPHVDSRQRTALQETVLEAAVAFCREEKTSTFLALETAVDALLAAEPAWGDT